MGSSRSNSPYRLLVVSLASFGVPCVPFFSLSLSIVLWSLAGLWDSGSLFPMVLLGLGGVLAKDF